MKRKFFSFIAVTIFVCSSVASASTFIYSPDRKYRATEVLMSGGGREFQVSKVSKIGYYHWLFTSKCNRSSKSKGDIAKVAMFSPNSHMFAVGYHELKKYRKAGAKGYKKGTRMIVYSLLENGTRCVTSFKSGWLNDISSAFNSCTKARNRSERIRRDDKRQKNPSFSSAIDQIYGSVGPYSGSCHIENVTNKPFINSSWAKFHYISNMSSRFVQVYITLTSVVQKFGNDIETQSYSKETKLPPNGCVNFGNYVAGDSLTIKSAQVVD